MHPSTQQLIEYALAARDVRNPVQGHLEAGCDDCRVRVEGYRELLEVMRSDRTAEPPAVWIARAVGLRRPAPWAERVREWCGERLVAVGHLIYDSFAGQEAAQAGARSVETERRLRLESDGLELDVRVEPVAGGGRVTGQVLRVNGEAEPLVAAPFLVTTGTSEVADGLTDEFGEFTLEIAALESLCLRFRVGDVIATFNLPGAGTAGD